MDQCDVGLGNFSSEKPWHYYASIFFLAKPNILVATKTDHRLIEFSWTFFFIILVPFTLASIKMHNFARSCSVLQNSKMTPWWQPNQGERLDRLIYQTLSIQLGMQFRQRYSQIKDWRPNTFLNIFGLAWPWDPRGPGTYSRFVQSPLMIDLWMEECQIWMIFSYFLWKWRWSPSQD